METNDKFWLSLVEELDVQARGEVEMPSGLPEWVEKLIMQMLNLMSPKLQLRNGDKPTPVKVGVLMACQTVQISQARQMKALPAPPTPELRAAFAKGVSLGPDPSLVEDGKILERFDEMESKIRNVILRIQAERPLVESAEFLKGYARGLRQPSASIVPKIVDGKPSYTPKQMENMRTMMIYSVTIQKWQQIDKLDTSRGAYDFLAKFIPYEFLGVDPERIRKMFYRLGKKFKDGGRPANK